MKMDQYYDSLGFERISQDRVTSLDDPIHQGIDGVYQNKSTGEYIIGEAKYNSSRLNKQTKQMSAPWIANKLPNSVGQNMSRQILKTGYQSNLYNIKANGSLNFKVLDAQARAL